MLQEYVNLLIESNDFINNAMEKRIPINIPRSDGSISKGIIFGIEEDYALVQFPIEDKIKQTTKIARKKVPFEALIAVN